MTYTGFNTKMNQIGRACLKSGADLEGAFLYDSAHLQDNSYPFGSLVLHSGAAGSVLTIGSLTNPGDYTSACYSSINDDKCRVIGVAFEIHNTTSALSKQGTLTVAMLPDSAKDTGNVLYIDTAAGGNIPYTSQASLTPVYAATASVLQSVPTSQTWPAADGCYVVPRMTATSLEINDLEYSSRTVVARDSTSRYYAVEPYGSLPVAGTVHYPVISGCEVSGFSPIQVHLSGLSSATTLSVTFRTIVEYFPGIQSNLLPLSSPSAPYDPAALQIYSRAITSAPYAVPVGQNSAGDYFRTILRVISKVAPVAAPFLGPFGPIVTAGGALARHFSEEKVEKKEAGAHANPVRSRR